MKQPLEVFLEDKGPALREALHDSELTDMEKLARVAVIGLKWMLDKAAEENSR